MNSARAQPKPARRFTSIVRIHGGKPVDKRLLLPGIGAGERLHQPHEFFGARNPTLTIQALA